MANVLPSFQPRPVNHAPSQFGFGFGLGGSVVAAPAWQSSVNPFHQLSSSLNQSPQLRVQKRRHEEDEPTVSRDHSMDRSPTPERPKRAAPKRPRVAPSADTGSREDQDTKENKAPSGTDDNDVDVGVLLASLPSQSLLPLLTALLSSQPSLKSAILPLIPRPTLDTALQTLSLSARKLRDAYPYSSPTQPASPAGFGFGNTRPVFGAFGRPPPPPAQPQSPSSSGGMRDDYIISRLRPHITEFVAACMSYMPYFSYVAAPFQSTSTAQSHSMTLQSLHKGQIPPSETYLFLAALTEHLFSQPALAQSLLAPLLVPRLNDEWKAWVDKLDVSLNQQGGMFPGDTVKSWERGMDAFAGARGEGAEMMRSVRDLWISKVGWLVGRQPMEEL
ncbi:hypothetical protein DFH07DRAFT_873832 [Mycena maculata]|uniref:Tethering factor for nuclear proteasome STS1 n=1 Tax=Mycena maculata TaxID=230809 RepID=A0AAD7KFP0_9AGAR|nr:hypothetical protein DFH07DRAFT_873832 [Mycena maculata]